LGKPEPRKNLEFEKTWGARKSGARENREQRAGKPPAFRVRRAFFLDSKPYLHPNGTKGIFSLLSGHRLDLSFWQIAAALGAFVAIGALTGFLAGLLGMGAGVLLAPLYFHAFVPLGVPSEDAIGLSIGTALAAIGVVSLVATAQHFQRGTLLPAQMMRFAAPLAVGALAGAVLVLSLDGRTRMAVCGAIVLLLALHFAFIGEAKALKKPQPVFFGYAMLLLSGGAAVLSAIGGGSFAATLLRLFGVSRRHVSAIAASLGLISAAIGTVAFTTISISPRPAFVVGGVHFVAALVSALVIIATTPIGARLARFVQPRLVRIVFAFFLVAIALTLLREAGVS
jgi:uncharacterized membrane protein YfcA